MRHIFTLCLLLFFAFWGCTNNNSAGGNSTETENAIAFLVMDSNGAAMGKVTYKVLPSNFRADTLQRLSEKDYLYSGESDAKGNIFLENHEPGAYVIEVQKDSLLSALAYNVQDSTEHSEKDVSNQIVLQKSGRVTGRVSLPEGDSYAWIFVNGTDRAVKTDSVGRFFIENVPSSKHLEFEAATAGKMEYLGSITSRVHPDDTTFIDVSTTDIKINVTELKLMDYISNWMRPLQSPTALTVRLDSSNLDFSQVKNNGKNLVLMDNDDGQPVPMQVTYWDSANARGILQVRISDLADTSRYCSLIEQSVPAEDTIDVWEDVSDSLYKALNTLLLGSFEYDTRQNALPSPVPVNFWYQSASENGTINPAKDDPFAYPYVAADSGRAGRAAHFSYTGNDPEYAVVGTTLSNGTRSLAQLDSLELWLRGDGDFSIALEDLSDTTFDGIKALYKGSCTSSWSRIVVRPQDFLPADSIFGNYGWDYVKYRITSFSIFARNGHDIWIDDIRLYGVNRDDLK